MTVAKSLTIFTDGGARGNPGPAGIGVYVVDEKGLELHSQSKFIGKATNNEAEYKAFLSSLEWLKKYLNKRSVESVTWKLDSKLVVEQVNKNWKVKEARLLGFVQRSWLALKELSLKHTIVYIPREENHRADMLVNLALDERV